MANKKTERAAWEVEFVSVSLSREEVETCKKWDEDYSFTLKEVDNALTKSAKIGFTYNQTTSSFTCSVTVGDPATGKRKRCFTSHAPDFMDALKIAAYKIAKKLDGDVFNLHAVGGVQEEWG
jgi:hypothetical protein